MQARFNWETMAPASTLAPSASPAWDCLWRSWHTNISVIAFFKLWNQSKMSMRDFRRHAGPKMAIILLPTYYSLLPTPNCPTLGANFRGSQWTTPLCLCLAGCPGPGSLFVIPAALQSQRARLSGHLHSDRHARDQGVCGARCHQCVHHHPLDGHENSPHRQEVSSNNI